MSFIIIVPPLGKHLAAPPAGPAALLGAADVVGFEGEVIDLNAAWLRRWSPTPAPASGPTGDHCKPHDRFALAEEAFCGTVRRVAGGGHRPPLSIDASRHLTHLGHDEIDAAALRLAESPWGTDLLDAWTNRSRPELVGLSIMWAEQVLFGLAASIVAKRAWPNVPVVWGGAHVTALAPEIAANQRYGRWIDGFVAGYAERTFAQILLRGHREVPEVFQAGSGTWRRSEGDLEVAPRFGNLGDYGVPRLVLPAWTSRGCVYGRCAFCTYPSVEGVPVDGSFAVLDSVIAHALEVGADVSIKDALVPARRLDQIAARIAGRVRWSACTRIAPAPERARLQSWVSGGLHTIELGVESVDPETLARMDKRQSIRSVESWLAAAENVDVIVVLNVLVALPGRAPDADERDESLLQQLISRHPCARVVVQRSALQVERRSRLAADPTRFGLRLGSAWPWSSVIETDPASNFNDLPQQAGAR